MIGAIDLGGTYTRFARYSDAETESPTSRSVHSTVSDYQAFMQLCKLESERWGPVSAVGVSFGVDFDCSGRIVTAASKDPTFVSRSIADDMEAIFGAPVRLAHDCICGVLAEADPFRRELLAYVTASTGIGAAVLLSTRRSQVAFRSRLAHLVIDFDGLQCACGQVGCLAAHTDSVQLSLRLGTSLKDADHVTFWEQFVLALAVGLVNLSWALPLRTIVVGGGIVLENQYVRERLPGAYTQLRKDSGRPSCALRYSRYGADAPLLGARRLAVENQVDILYGEYRDE